MLAFAYSIDPYFAWARVALDGSLAKSDFSPDPVFKVLVPRECAR